ncbi:hypothetical protein [Corallococcus exercitus]|uniref:Lipoprotein n=1 Tax=Corallococcus exercitus TaxID=2316736 RepID=A0A7Y4K124_9BACT|nr:hypothetical protein [Corallococcus exercitus]NOK14478.1 hypothetical protein [Corallococcus exercitus]
MRVIAWTLMAVGLSVGCGSAELEGDGPPDEIQSTEQGVFPSCPPGYSTAFGYECEMYVCTNNTYGWGNVQYLYCTDGNGVPHNWGPTGVVYCTECY